MSLINQMLNDLEARRGGQALNSEQVLTGVHAAGAADTAAPGYQSRVLLLAVALGMAAAGIAWYGLRALERVDGASAVVSPAAPPLASRVLAETQVVVPDNQTVAPDHAAAALAQSAALVDDLPAPGPIPAGTTPAELPTAPDSVPPPRAAHYEPLLETMPLLSDTEQATADTVQTAVENATPADIAPDVEYAGTIEKTTLATDHSPRAELAAIVNRLQRAPEAIGDLKSFVAAHPQLVAAREAWVTHLLRRERREEAERVLRDGLSLNAHESRYTALLAHLMVARGDVKEALTMLEQGRPGDNDVGDYYAFMAALNQRLGRHAAAIANYRHALNQTPATGVWWIGLGISLSAESQAGPAQHAFRRALSDRGLSDKLRQYAHREIGRLNGSS